MKLRYQKRALGQIDKALGYIGERSPQGAANVEARLTEILQLLRQQPLFRVKTKIPRVRQVVLIPHPM